MQNTGNLRFERWLKRQALTGQDAVEQRAEPDQPPPGATLDPGNWAEFRLQAHRMLDDMLRYTENIQEHPVWQVIPAEVRMRFHQQIPVQPMPLEQVHQEFMSSVLPYTARNGHPGFFGWVQGGGTPVGMLAEMLAAGLNANVGGRDQIPLDVERQVTEWMRTLFGFPIGATGLFLTGTSMANVLAVKVARDAKLGWDVRRRGIPSSQSWDGPRQTLVAYASEAVHGCVPRAFDLVGLGSDSMRLISVDSRHRMDLKALAAAVSEDWAAGLLPFFVAGTAGTVDTGAIDDLNGLAAFCAEQKLWFHVDGACGALGMLAAEIAPRLKGIERADSLAFDFHKWAQVPYDAGFLLVRDGALHQQAFSSSSAYLAREESGMAAGSPWPCDYGPDLSRGFRALKAWMTLKVHGTQAIGAVISHTCELAHYLERRIAETPDLELMAPVELNIVCFRYRSSQSDDTATEKEVDQVNQQIVAALQEGGAVAPSTTRIRHRLAIRAAIVNHRTTSAHVDTLIDSVLSAGRYLARCAFALKAGEPQWLPWLERNAKLEMIDARLATEDSIPKAAVVGLRYARAMLLTQIGRTQEARSEHLKVVECDPTHERNLNALGLLLATTGNRKAALLALAEAVKHHPASLDSRVNFGAVLLEENDPETAREQFAAALRMDPEFRQAHAGMYYALAKLGAFEAAEPHRQKGFAGKNVFTNLYRGNGEPVPVLLLVSSTGGNTPVEKLLDDTVFQTTVIVADFFARSNPLPAHRMVINGIGDADISEPALLAAEAILAHTSARVFNLPAAVIATGRCQNAARLRSLPGVIAPATQMIPYSKLASAEGVDTLLQLGFTFPLLLRAPGFHAGEHFIQVESAAMLPAAVAELPGEGRPEAKLLAIEYLDARGPDGCFRKYRVMMIDGRLYPLHLAISPRWKIHYFSADMEERPDHRAEEASFLADMPGFLGATVTEALARLQATLALDYGGVDFGLDQWGNVLLFEANATMVVQHPDKGEHWDYRRAAVNRIHTAFREMMLNNAVIQQRDSEQPVPLLSC